MHKKSIYGQRVTRKIVEQLLCVKTAEASFFCSELSPARSSGRIMTLLRIPRGDVDDVQEMRPTLIEH